MGRLVKNISGQSNVGSAQSLLIPSGTTAERPATPQAGMIRFNTSLAKFEFFNGTNFVNVTGGIGGVGDIHRDFFTMDGSTLTFTMTRTPVEDQNILVFIEGVFQHSSKYTVSGNVLTLATTGVLDAGATLSVIHGFDSI